MSLAHLRVIELVDSESVAATVATAWASKLFADLGADVIRLVGDNDPIRARPHQIDRWLNANKRCVDAVADVDAVRGGAAELPAGGQGGVLRHFLTDADLVIHSGVNPALTPSATSASAPSLVVCSISPFGRTGPYADYAAGELAIIHGSSWGNLSPSGATDASQPPLKAPGHHASLNVATAAAAASASAVLRAQETGHGEHIDFSMFAAAAKMTEFSPAAALFLGADSSRLGGKTVVPWGVFECADGLIQIICPEQAQWESLVELMGNPEWALMDVVATPEARRDNADVVELFLSGWMATQSVADLAVAAQSARVCITPVSTMSQLTENAHLKARGFFVQDPDGLSHLGPGYKLDQDWWALRTSVQEPTSVADTPWRARKRPPDHSTGKHSAAAANPTSARPLEGVRICDFTWIWAGPFCTQYLAHLGAEVIKLESADRPCMFRRLPFNPPATEADLDNSGSFHIYNSDKLSIGVDLQHSASRDVVARLVANSDVVVDNFGVGTMASLGWSIEELRAINPDIIVASLSGYGQTGPNSSYMAYGPAGGSLAGLYAANGYEGGPAKETGLAVGDPCTGITAAWAITAALNARSATGVAAVIDVSMVESVATTIGELWAAYQADGTNPERQGNHDLVWAPHQCYPALGEDQWVTIACMSDHQWRALATVVDQDLATDPRFASAADRKLHEAELDTLLGAWTSQQDRWTVTDRLQAVGVAAFPSLSPMDLWSGDPQMLALGMINPSSHPKTGDRPLPGIPWQLHRGPNGLRRPAPLLGQHTDEVLGDLLGFSETEIEALRAAGAIA